MRFFSSFSHIPYKKHISALLIAFLLISQTIHINFFDKVAAGPEAYRDIVSLIVDSETYRQQNSRIKRYASDIAGYLGGVRTVISVVEKDTPVSTIAARQEKLYYEGDGEEGSSHLVGSVLIGNIPIPLVQKEAASFRSIYPYVDFEDKAFVYDALTQTYTYHQNQGGTESVEIWHGVINPALGRNWSAESDITQIGDFLDKTHDFYIKSGKFSPNNIPPKVFYYDGYSENESIDIRGLFQYGLNMQNSENIAYNRFTKYLLSDISHALQSFDEQHVDGELSQLTTSFGIPSGSDTLSDKQIQKIPDIQTREATLAFLKNFQSIFNEKSLGDQLKAVHNAGRYNSGNTVSVDILPTNITLMDDIARTTLKTSNQAIANKIDTLVGTISAPIILYDKRVVTSSGSQSSTQNSIQGRFTQEYKNYSFGTPVSSIQSVSSCTIARGYSGDVSQFGRSVLVEANTAFDISVTQSHISRLKDDTDAMIGLHRNSRYSCFGTNASIKLDAYWGGNSILKIASAVSGGGDASDFLFQPPPVTSFLGLSEPIYSLGGMKETSRLPNPSLQNCIDPKYQYALLSPYIVTYSDTSSDFSRTYTVAYPDEWNVGGVSRTESPRFTCNTLHKTEAPIPFEESVTYYKKGECLVGSVFLNGKKIITSEKSCIVTDTEGGVTSDRTHYEDRYYHSLSSIWSHISPTDEELAAAKNPGTTPSLAIDQVRFIEFLTPKGNVARINYPNFFDIQGSTISEARAWITRQSLENWNVLIQNESKNTGVKIFPEYLSVGTSPTTPVDWNVWISDEMIERILQARMWLYPDVSAKYKKALSSMLSYSSQKDTYKSITTLAPELPKFQGQDYEIAYLGLPKNFTPDFSFAANSKSIQDYNAKIREIDAINISDEQDIKNPEEHPESQCGPPDGVPLLQWPGAIMCWIQAQFPPKIFAGSCSASTLGIDHVGNAIQPSSSNLAHPLSGVRIVPVSSAIIKGNKTLVMIRLVDKFGNEVNPDIHTLKISVAGGYLIDDLGEKKTSMSMDIMETQIPVIVGSDSAGLLRITATIDDVLSSSTELNVYNTAKVVLLRSGDPQVGGKAIPVQIEVQDEFGKPMTGISSLIAWSLPDGAGSFSQDTIEITDGKSGVFQYIPGSLAGSHALVLDIPGIGTISDILFSVLPGNPLYITHNKDDNGIHFFLKDRYANTVTTSLSGSLRYNNGAPRDISFLSGILDIPNISGYYTLQVPRLSDYELSYQDDSGVYTLKGIDTYSVFIGGEHESIEFPIDYNARYTVLAGGSFLNEAESILYKTDNKKSQSLAVSTLLDATSHQNVLVTIFPHGEYTINSTSDVSASSSISLSNGTPLLTLFDDITHKNIAQVLYPMQGATLEVCPNSGLADCMKRASRPTIRVAPLQDEITISYSNESLILKGFMDYMTVNSEGKIRLAPGVRLEPLSNDFSGFGMSVLYQGVELARVFYTMDINASIAFGNENSVNAPKILASNFGYEKFSITSNASRQVFGYKILTSSQESDTLDSQDGPSHTDSISMLSQKSGIGWQDNNTFLLSYAGGDTVGEATRLFQTYTFVNLGDPVAHIDAGKIGTQKEGIDRTIGTLIARSNQSRISRFEHRDMNHDGIADLMVIYQDGYIQLFLNLGGKFRSRGMILYNKDIDPSKVYFGDFTGDGYGDMASLDKNGSLVLVDNSDRRWNRKNIILDGGAQVPTGITQLRVYDMDADKKDDIVYLTAGGELGILYGSVGAGQFTKKVLDPTLGIKISEDSINIGGAIRSSITPQYTAPFGVSSLTNTGTDESLLQSEVFYQYSYPSQSVATENTTIASLSGAFADIVNGKTGTESQTYVRSQYSGVYGLQIEKTYKNLSHPTLFPGDNIEARIRITNTAKTKIQNIEYLDTTIPAFSIDETKTYTIVSGNTQVERNFEIIGDTEYDAHFILGSLDPGASLDIIYQTKALPASYGELSVGDFEKGTVGADLYGDVGFKTSTTCGNDMLLWTSTANREYIRGTHEFGQSILSSELTSKIQDVQSLTDTTDSNKDGIPDALKNANLDTLRSLQANANKSSQQTQEILKVSQGEGLQMSIGFDDQAVNTLLDAAQNLANGLSCGFGGGGCLNSPVNWAPLAPGSAPSVFGIPAGIMSPSTGMPIFSGLTGIPIYGPWGCFPVPTVYPASPLGYATTCTTNTPNAGGYLGTTDPTNFIRIYVTPTLTLGMGTAICFGGPALTSGNIPPTGLSPLVPGGNCIVMAASLPVCKGDGSSSDGDVRAVSGLGTIADTWNSQSCEPQIAQKKEDVTLTQDIISYLKNPRSSSLQNIYQKMSQRGPSSISQGPLLQIGGASSTDQNISIEVDSNTSLSNIGSVIKVKNKRIAAFPDFMMDWLTRQTEEITTSLFTPPNLTIIPPTSLGQNAQLGSDGPGITDRLGKAFSQAGRDEMKQAMGNAYTQGSKSTNTSIPSPLQQGTKTVQGNLQAIKSAYNYIGKLPFLSLRPSRIPINIPWINKTELDKYERSMNSYIQEIDKMVKNMCINDTSKECLDRKGKLQSGAFISSVRENLRIIGEYKRLPEKLQKYITVKERYLAQLLCNIQIIQNITGGWLKDNGIRFRRWVELYVLIKAIADGWQPLLDIFADTNKNCGVCRNERNSLQYWKFKLLSMLIPSLPVIKFPKWPDIVLDTSDVRLGIAVALPDFDPRISPIRLPSLPNLSFGDVNATLGLPSLPLIPPIPSLPDLPDLPSLPRIKLPDLPPPPKIPKISGAIVSFLNIMKLVSKMYCYYQKTILVPEWQAGDVIAQRTDRQGTLPFDFLNINYPQFSLPTLREIRVGSHVNYEMRSDFVTEAARNSVKPVNELSTDFQNILPSKIGTDVGVPSQTINLNKKLQSYLPEISPIALSQITQTIQSLEDEKDVFLDVNSFSEYILSQSSNTPEFSGIHAQLQRGLAQAKHDADSLVNELEDYNNKRFELLREVISSSSNDTAKLKNIIDALSEKNIDNLHEMISDISSTQTHSEYLIEQYNTLYGEKNISESITTRNDDTLEDTRTKLLGKTRYLAELVGTNNSSNTSQISNGEYSPNYQGIYILTPSGVQTRLFDYIDLVSNETQIQSTDIDSDGDLDYLILLDGSLYVKYNHTYEPKKIIDNSIKIIPLSSVDFLQYVPDYFFEDLSVPKNLNYSFTPAYVDETEWRMDFYDQYMQWDSIDIGSVDPNKLPKTIVEMFLTRSPVRMNSFMSTIPVQRSISRIFDEKSFIIEGRSIEVYTGSLIMNISPGRTIYTGNKGLSLSYSMTGSQERTSIKLNPYTAYTIEQSMDISMESGKFFLIGGEDGSRYTYSSEFIGLPILPGMKIYASDSGMEIMNHTTNTLINIPPESSYLSVNLGEKSSSYQVSLPYQNGYYFARLSNLTTKKNDRAGVILLSPQDSSDSSEPIIDIPSRLRLPIYARKTYKISDIVTDLSHARILADDNILLDADKNGIMDDDFSLSGEAFRVTQTDIEVGPFLHPGIYTLNLQAQDDMGNTSTMPLSIEAYSPIPQIQSVTASGWVDGNISDLVGGVPIHFFRVRSGEGPILVTSGSVLTDTYAHFASGSFFGSPETIDLLSGSGNTRINNRGVFSLMQGEVVTISPAQKDIPMRIYLQNQSGSISHIHTLMLPQDVKISELKTDSGSHNGVIITPFSGSHTSLSPLVSPSLPGGMYVTDEGYHPLLAIAKDGNIYAFDPTIVLKYRPMNGFLGIEAMKNNTVVATIEYHIDFFYTMK